MPLDAVLDLAVVCSAAAAIGVEHGLRAGRSEVAGQGEVLRWVCDRDHFPVQDCADRSVRLDEQVAVPEVSMPDCWLVVLHTLVSQELIPPPADALDLALGHTARERKLGVLPEVVPVLPHLVRAGHGGELAGFDMVEGRQEGAQLAAGGLGGRV